MSNPNLAKWAKALDEIIRTANEIPGHNAGDCLYWIAHRAEPILSEIRAEAEAGEPDDLAAKAKLIHFGAPAPTEVEDGSDGLAWIWRYGDFAASLHLDEDDGVIGYAARKGQLLFKGPADTDAKLRLLAGQIKAASLTPPQTSTADVREAAMLLNDAVDDMWNDISRVKENRIHDRHVDAIIKAQGELQAALTPPNPPEAGEQSGGRPDFRAEVLALADMWEASADDHQELYTRSENTEIGAEQAGQATALRRVVDRLRTLLGVK